MSCNDNQSFCETDQTIGGNLTDIIASDSELSELLGGKNDPLDFLDVSGGKITTDIWKMLEKILKATNSFGELGKRDYPSVVKGELEGWPTNVEKFLEITPEHYNNIVDILKKSNILTTFNTVESKSLILGESFTDLKEYIKNFKIDANRCDSCNVSCYSSYSCGQGCGEGCGQACTAGNQSCNQTCYQGCVSGESGGGGCSSCQSCVSCQSCMTCQSCYGQGCSSCDIGCYSGYSCSRDL